MNKNDSFLAARFSNSSLRLNSYQFTQAWMKKIASIRCGIIRFFFIFGLAGSVIGCGTTPVIEPTASPTQTASPSPTPTVIPTPTQVLTIGSSKVRELDGMVMFFVPAGEFLMGSADSDPQAGDDEKPQHTVFLDAFWIDQTEVTNDMYARCVADNACTPPMEIFSSSRENYYGNPEFANYPVIFVKRINAIEYCQWAGARLPSEAEWEKAARGVNGNLFPWGNEFDCTTGNFDDEVKFDKPVVPGGPHCDGYEDDTSPVGNYPSGASPYGALDMAGNVWEWVGSNFLPYPYNATDGREDLNSKVDHIIRGGANGSTEDRLRTSERFSFFFPTSYHIGFGFRCADSLQ